MIVVKMKTLIASVAILIALLCVLGFWGYGVAVFENAKSIVVIVDAGHGDPDGGAVGVDGTLEKDINLQISKKVEEVLEGKGIRVIMTRSGDAALFENRDGSIREKKREDMNTRLSIMKKSGADLFLSIHMNSFDNKKANGLHVFYAQNHPEVEVLAKNIQERISDITGAATHAVKTADKSLFLMKNPPIPAVLCECGFLSNPEEVKKLKDDDYQSRIAWAIATALEEYFMTA